MMNRKSTYYLIEGGLALEIVKKHILQLLINRNAILLILDELGVTDYRIHRDTHALVEVALPKPHADFTKKNRKGFSHPKKGSIWADRFNAIPEVDQEDLVIGEAFGIPCGIEWTSDAGYGFSSVGWPFNASGFLFLSENGPYAMHVPNCDETIKEFEAEGKIVTNKDAFKIHTDGLKQIEEEEWEILVLQHQLSEKRKNQ